MKSFISSCFLFLLLSYHLTAQPGWTIYNSTNSPLPENSVRCIAIDHNGVKWVGTDYGLASFDDVTWNVFQTFNSGIPDNSIRSLAVDQQNNLWIGTFSGGLAKYDGAVFTVYNIFNSDLPDDFVRCLAVDTLNKLWVGTIGGLAYFDEITWEIYNNSNSILGSNNIGSLFVDNTDNSVSIGTINGGLTIKEDTTWTLYSLGNSNLPDNTILGLDKDSSGVLWMATPAAGLSAHIGGFSFLTLNTVSSTIASNSLTGISIAPDESIWASCNDSGIIKRSGNSFYNYNTVNSPLPDDFVHTVFTDSAGIIWIGTLQGGLIRFDESLYLGLENEDKKESLQLYPVPANEWITINTTSDKMFDIYIYDISGQVIYTENFISNKSSVLINTSHFASGVYSARVVLKSGYRMDKKFVVLHP